MNYAWADWKKIRFELMINVRTYFSRMLLDIGKKLE
jgi:hypothetical protein